MGEPKDTRKRCPEPWRVGLILLAILAVALLWSELPQLAGAIATLQVLSTSNYLEVRITVVNPNAHIVSTQINGKPTTYGELIIGTIGSGENLSETLRGTYLVVNGRTINLSELEPIRDFNSRRGQYLFLILPDGRALKLNAVALNVSSMTAEGALGGMLGAMIVGCVKRK